MPNSGHYQAVAASAATGRLYLAVRESDEVICLDLVSGAIIWRRHFGVSADGLAISPGGERAYIAFRGKTGWKAVSAANGADLHSVTAMDGEETTTPANKHTGTHSMEMNPSGTRLYLSTPCQPFVYIIGTGTSRLLGRIGPFSSSVMQFVVDSKERYIYAVVQGVPGFEVAEIKQEPWGGRMISRVQMLPPPKRVSEVAAPEDTAFTVPPHGIALHPDDGEVWVADSAYGYVYAFDTSSMPPRESASIPLYKNPKEQPHPTWIAFGRDGRFLYTDVGSVIDTHTRKIAARFGPGDKVVEVEVR